uniref:Uncharacterized protein n=1 Tax=Anguilla anguilla TaxID=7936 RepID=A0A0E9T3I3_ANGAN
MFGFCNDIHFNFHGQMTLGSGIKVQTSRLSNYLVLSYFKVFQIKTSGARFHSHLSQEEGNSEK